VKEAGDVDAGARPGANQSGTSGPEELLSWVKNAVLGGSWRARGATGARETLEET